MSTRTTPLRRASLALLAAPVLGLVAACAPPPPPDPCTPVVLDQGHVDAPGIAFEDGGFDLHVHDEETDTEYAPECAVLAVKDEAATTVPADPDFSFLGDPGAPLWVLPAVEDPELLYLGYGTEEIEAGVLEGDQLTWSLTSVSGPGDFALYTVDGFGAPTVLFAGDDPLPQALTVPTGDHAHANWAFGAPGEYTLTYEVSGTPAGGAPVSSGPVEYTFTVGG